MKPVLIPLLALVAVLSLVLPAPESAAKGGPAGTPARDPVAALEGGTPVPDAPAKAGFLDFAKQSVTFTSDADAERMVGIVAFGAGPAPLGSAETDGKGGGSLSFKIPVTALTTGNKDRDEHMAGPTWLDGAKFPEVSFTSTKVERVAPTVWKATGTWSMHGVQKEMTLHANVRHIGKIERVGESVIRVRATFPLSLKAFGIENQYVGSAAVAESWEISVDLLGVLEGTKGGAKAPGGSR